MYVLSLPPDYYAEYVEQQSGHLQYSDAHVDQAQQLHTLEPAVSVQHKDCFTFNGNGPCSSSSSAPLLQEAGENGGMVRICLRLLRL